MTARATVSLWAIGAFSAAAGFFTLPTELGHRSSNAANPIPLASLQLQGAGPVTGALPTVTLPDLYDPRAAFHETLTYEPRARRLSSWFLLGYELAKDNPATAFAALEPEIWESPYYDLRGSLAAEWLRRDPRSFLAWAEPKYQELADQHLAERFPYYGIAYLATDEGLALLPHLHDESLAKFLRLSLLEVLIEKDPERLWDIRHQLADLATIIDSASYMGFDALAHDFWSRAGYAETVLPSSFIEYLAKQSGLRLIAHLNPADRVELFAAVAATQPNRAATWLLSEKTTNLEEFAYGLDSEHLPFLRHLVRQPGFFQLNNASEWIVAIAEEGDPRLKLSTLQALAQQTKVATSTYRSIDSFFLTAIESDAVAELYLSLDPEHALTAALESCLLEDPETYGSTLALKAALEETTSDRVVQALQFGNLSDWPQEFASRAREALLALPVDDLAWRLSPDLLLPAATLIPERIEALLRAADPSWVANTLSHPELLAQLDFEDFNRLDKLLDHLPAAQASLQRQRAQHLLINRGIENGHPVDLLAELVSDPRQGIMLGESALFSPAPLDDASYARIAAHPHGDVILLSMAQSFGWSPDANETDSGPPEFAAIKRLSQEADELIHQSSSSFAAAVQTRPASERMLLAKAAILKTTRLRQTASADSLIALPIWSESERRELASLKRGAAAPHQLSLPDSHYD